MSRVARYTSADFVSEVRFAPDEDTIALWDFDEGAGTVAHDETTRHPRTIRGAAWIPTPCSR